MSVQSLETVNANPVFPAVGFSAKAGSYQSGSGLAFSGSGLWGFALLRSKGLGFNASTFGCCKQRQHDPKLQTRDP